MASLAGPGVRVLLIGASRYEDPELPDLPSVATTVDDLARTLYECCEVSSGRIRTLLDPAGVEELGDAVATTAAEAEDVLVVYYAGHGQLDRRGNLYLATRATGHLRDGLEYRAFEYEKLRGLLPKCRARTIVVILDCCFSGNADVIAPALADLKSPHAAGGYLLASARPEELSLAPEGARHTAFGGMLIRLLREGDRSADEYWTLAAISRLVKQRREDRNEGRTHSVGSDNAGELVLGRNPISNPYPGLAPYGTSDARDFFGRKDMTQRLLGRLADQLAGAGTLVVVGPSGSGKSSLLSAGLVPALGQNGLPGVPGASDWPIRTFAPGDHPLRMLVAEATEATRDEAVRLRETLASDPARLSSEIRARPDIGQTNRRMILVVDHFEEVFTACQDPAERVAFGTALLAAAQARSALVVLGLRADFYPECAAQPWPSELFENQLIVGAMDEHQLQAVMPNRGQRKRRWDRPTLEHGRPGPAEPGAGRQGRRRQHDRLQPRRAHARQRARRPDDPAVEPHRPGTRDTAGPAADRPRQRDPDVGFRPGRPHPGQRRRRSHHPALAAGRGTDDPARLRHHAKRPHREHLAGVRVPRPALLVGLYTLSRPVSRDRDLQPNETAYLARTTDRRQPRFSEADGISRRQAACRGVAASNRGPPEHREGMT